MAKKDDKFEMPVPLLKTCIVCWARRQRPSEMPVATAMLMGAAHVALAGESEFTGMLCEDHRDLYDAGKTVLMLRFQPKPKETKR